MFRKKKNKKKNKKEKKNTRILKIVAFRNLSECVLFNQRERSEVAVKEGNSFVFLAADYISPLLLVVQNYQW